ncbi:uncharacterized protein MAM_00347 [Metarhizium album ARSEF 1941]|uniref:Uncharacterized protein n=1 Tax=Metarhizium album (strain ARSEF 1941) TaxID=1081103 RepID=A0A0B2X7T5_METAS|nr:uncharacterized protein MAM_00347 [Metarhizium album ARSEF 1941]KHO01346.1 hypothetical protein MAM_00347 [Metarhizium album ARSEF 1941]
MVSLFGLKLGSDRKKAQIKQAQGNAPQKWSRFDQYAFDDSQYPGNNLSRPRFRSTTRPSTAHSTSSMSSWRAVFKNPAVTSSMADLASPRRRPSVGSLRHVASDWNTRPGTAFPAALQTSGFQPGVPSRTPGNQKAGWISPSDIHLCKNPANIRPATPLGQNPFVTAPATPRSPKSPLAQSDFEQHTGRGEHANTSALPFTVHNGKLDKEIVTQTANPSPPPSDTNSEGALSPVNVPASENRPPLSGGNAPSALKNVDMPEPISIPSPEGLIVRSVRARRDTFAFHQPRRQSFTMEFEGSNRATVMHPPKEGFSGNFADFDFGQGVARAASNTSAREVKPSFDAATRPSMSSESTSAMPPRPLQPVVPPPATNDVEVTAMDAYGPPADSGIGCSRSEPTPRPAENLGRSAFSRPPMEGDFPMYKGLPRGRQRGPRPPPLSSFDDKNAFKLPMWSGFDRSEPRRSAIPAPLTPSRPSSSRSPKAGLSTPTSATAPRIPSPTFSSLAQSSSNSGDTFEKSFGINLDEYFNSLP